MRKALVAIGVDRTSSGFPLLRAAYAGASKMSAWGRAQGFDVTAFPEKSEGTVSVNEVFKAIDAIVAANIYSQLIIYFSGHGILLSPDAEVWLLSDAMDNPNEAINVSGSIVAARTCGIEHVVFVSDACRSMPAGFRMGMVNPGVIFPSRRPRAPMPEVDVFYATLPGDPALEVPPDAARDAFRGLLTDCLLQGLGGTPQTLIEKLDDAGTQRRVVASRPLKGYLIQAVPEAASAVSIKLQQNPDVRVESALPKFISEIVGEPVLEVPMLEGVAVSKEFALPAETVSFALRKSWRSAVQPLHPFGPDTIDIPDVGDVKKSVDQIVHAAGRVSFETRTGFTVHGTSIFFAAVTGIGCSVFEENGAFHVRVHEDYHGDRFQYRKRSAIIQFAGGSGVVLAVLQGYIGTVVVDGDRVATVNYTPSRGTPNYLLYSATSAELEQRRAFVAVAARHGSFRFDSKAAVYTAMYLRRLKQIDPTLGLYAAYAYAQAGDDEGVLSVHDYMSHEPQPVLFDVAMLALQRSDDIAPNLDFTPWMPMLTQGWMLLGKFSDAMPEPLRKARQYLLPALWTTFAPEGVEILVKASFGGRRQ